MKLEDFLTNNQISIITNIIMQKCTEYRQYEKQREKYCYEPYMVGRQQYDLTGFILSGFIPNTDAVPAMCINEIKYGHGRCQPELVGDNVILNIYSESNDLSSQYIFNQCAKYNIDLNKKPTFGCLIFETDESYYLIMLTLKIMDRYANCIEKFIVYKKPELAVRSA